MARPALSAKQASTARRGSGNRPRTPRAKAVRSRPDTRTTPIPPRPGAVAIAAMVSALGVPFGGMRQVQATGDPPLLRDGQDVVDHPVQHQPGGEEKEEDAEGEGHDQHYLG